METRHPLAPHRFPVRWDGRDRFLARSPERIMRRPHHTDGFVLGRALLFMMFLVAVDVKDFWDKSGSSARYALVLIPRFNTLFVAALFNPEIEAVGRGATVFGIYAMMMVVGEPALAGGRERI